MPTTHTPGPWTAVEVLIFAGEGKTHRVIGAGTESVEFYQTTPEDEANTRLMAAAPELLGALKECAEVLQMVDREFHEPGDMPSPTLERALAAIAKAEGL